jgi:hypothetical protein
MKSINVSVLGVLWCATLFCVSADHTEKIVLLPEHIINTVEELGLPVSVSNDGEYYISSREADLLCNRVKEILTNTINYATDKRYTELEAYCNALKQGDCYIDYETYKKQCKSKSFKELCVKHSACVKNRLCTENFASCALSANEIDPDVVRAQEAQFTDLTTTYLTGTSAFITNLTGVQTINGLDIADLLAPAITGATGVTGATGQQGAQGLTGTPGVQGAQGPQGAAFEQNDYVAVNKTSSQVLSSSISTIQYDAFELNDNNSWTTTDFQTFIIPTAGLYRFTYSITYTSTVNLSFVSNAFLNSFTISPAQLRVTDNTPNQVRTISTSFLERVFSNNSTLSIRVVIGSNPATLTGLPVISSFSATRL